jgi:hypothetical protein
VLHGIIVGAGRSVYGRRQLSAAMRLQIRDQVLPGICEWQETKS